ncbi:hypothetical protein B7494_g6878 [Chlorociboria aeruginascens]|nr:hypothetical protein B7494_g6878 [Chlorociboria aeruginascens]
MDGVFHPEFLQTVIFTYPTEVELEHAAFKILEKNGMKKWKHVPLDVSVFAPANTPLNGLRIAVKDIYDLKGFKTAGSSRSYNQLYPMRAKSASSVQKLIDLGAVIVGKTKTTTFADREIPTGDWIDTHAPFNPRGDGYLVPGGSTSSGGAALASYEWLDIAIGTDTSGSIRWPAAHGGLFGFKPTYAVMPMDGIIPSSRKFDVPAYLTRDIKSANSFARQWFGLDRFEEPKDKQPSRLLYPLDYVDPTRERTMSTNLQVLDVFEGFVQKLEAYMGAKHYNKEFGRDPYLPPSTANRWMFGRNITAEDRAVAVKQVDVYKAWFEEHVLGPDSDTLSNAILVLPWTAGFANYRDTIKPIPNDSFGHGFWSSYITSFTTGPELVFPIRTWTYDSKVIHRQERLPVAAGIVGAPGSDFGVLNFVQDFLSSSCMKDHVLTGSEVFEEPSSTFSNNLKVL